MEIMIKERDTMDIEIPKEWDIAIRVLGFTLGYWLGYLIDVWFLHL